MNEPEKYTYIEGETVYLPATMLKLKQITPTHLICMDNDGHTWQIPNNNQAIPTRHLEGTLPLMGHAIFATLGGDSDV